MTTKVYSNQKPLTPKTEGIANVELIGPTSTMAFAFTLVDTGADYVMLPQYAAHRTGINLSSGSRIRIKTASGTQMMHLVSNVNLEIEGKGVQTEVLFNPSPQSRSLLGRNGIRALGEIGFDLSDWLWEP